MRQNHQPRDFAQHRVIDTAPTDEPPQPVDVKLRVAGALIVDQEVDAIASTAITVSGRPSGRNGGVSSSSPINRRRDNATTTGYRGLNSLRHSLWLPGLYAVSAQRTLPPAAARACRCSGTAGAGKAEE